jgi:hypothetical protein
MLPHSKSIVEEASIITGPLMDSPRGCPYLFFIDRVCCGMLNFSSYSCQLNSRP